MITKINSLVLRGKDMKSSSISDFTVALLRMSSIAALAIGSLAAEQAMAQAAPGSAPQAATSDKAEEASNRDIVVTGTSIRGAAPVGSALVSVGRTAIAAIGAQTTQDIIKNTPAFGAFGQALTPSNDFGQVGIKPSIHNIGAGATLTLLDGHRMVGAGILQTNPDPSVIPPSAIERMEIIADGASAIYGSDAIAGVVNVILRRNFDGLEVSGRYGFADNYHTHDINGVFGRVWDGGSFMIAAEYTANNAIYGYNRSFVTLDQRSLGGADLRSNAAIPANITVNGRTYAYPSFSTTPNLYDTSQVGSLIPDASRVSVLSTLRQNVSDKIELYGQAFYSSRKSTNTVDPGGQTPTIRNTNPFFVNVPGEVATSETARLNLLPLVGVLRTPSRLQSLGVTVGANIMLGKWRAVIEGNYGHEDDLNEQQAINATAFAAAAAGTTAATALDPFGGKTNPAVLAGFVGVNSARNLQDLKEGTLRLDGPLFALPAGDVKLAVGTQYHYESLSQSYNTIGVANTLSSQLSRTFFSQYAEALIPVFGGDVAFPMMRKLDLSLSIRHDHYSDAGDTTNPKFGANYSPIKGMKLHASYGTSFHAPSLADKNPSSIDTRVQPLIASTTFAPPGALPSNYFYLAGSDAGLTPEKAKTWSAGGDYSPPFLPGLTVGATWWRVKYTNIVSIAFPPALYTDASLAKYFVNNPTDAQIASFIGNLRVDGLAANDTASKVALLSGATRMIDLRRKNLGILDAQGIDYNVNYRVPVGAGTVTFNWSGTGMLNWKTQVSPTAAVVDNFANGTQIRWRTRTSLAYNNKHLGAQLAYNHVGGYTNLGVAAQPQVSAYKTFDFSANYKIDGKGILSGLELTVNADNLGDQAPPVRITGNGYSTISNPLGRTISFGLRKTF